MSDTKNLWIFSLSAFFLFGAMIVGAAWRQGWFMPRENFSISFPTANGLFVGTPVLLTGLKIGEVKSVDLDEDGQVQVQVSVLSKYASQLREDASAHSQRTFVIGEKIIALSPGSRDKGPLAPEAELPGREMMEITDILSGGHMTRYFETLELLMEQLNVLVGAAGDKDTNLAVLYRQFHRSLQSVEALAKDVRIMRSDVLASEETKLLISNLSKSSRDMEAVMSELKEALPRLNEMSGEVQQTLPTFSKALQESVVTLQAMQRSFFLRGGVKELREEQEREPASEIQTPTTTP